MKKSDKIKQHLHTTLLQLRTTFYIYLISTKKCFQAGLRVKLSDGGREYLTLWDREKGTHYYDEGVGTVVASGRYAYLGLCDVKWDSGNKPEVDNTYYVYNCGNDGLYHLALVDEPKWELPVVEERAVSEKERQTLEILREQRGVARETLSTPATTAAALYDELRTRHGFSLPRDRVGAAVDESFVAWDTPLRDGQTVVFIPPVAGG